MEKKHLIIIERTGSGFSAYVDGLDGVVTTGSTMSEVRINITEALDLYYEGEGFTLSLTFK